MKLFSRIGVPLKFELIDVGAGAHGGNVVVVVVETVVVVVVVVEATVVVVTAIVVVVVEVVVGCVVVVVVRVVGVDVHTLGRAGAATVDGQAGARPGAAA